MGAFLAGIRSGLRLLRRQKKLFDAEYQRGDWGTMQGVALSFSAAPPLMCSGIVVPDYDFSGRRLPDSSGTDLPDDFVLLDIVGAGDRGVAVLAWRTGSQLAGEALARTLLALPREQMADAIVRLVFEGTENWFCRPSWWEGLSRPVRADLEGRLLCGSTAKSHTSRCVAKQTVTYDLPPVDDVQLVNWAG